MNADVSTPPAEQSPPEKRVVDAPPEVEAIPRVLLWCMGALAALLLLVGGCVVILRWWDCLHVGVQVAFLLLPLVGMWGGYALAARRGVCPAELMGAFASVSWLLVLLVWHTLAPATPIWLLGGLFVLGALGVAVFCPNRSSVVMLGVASVAVMALVWYQTTAGWSQPADVLVWAGVVEVLCLWGIGGFLCGLSRHTVYAPYAFLGPLMFSVYLLVLQGLLLYCPRLPGCDWQSWLCVAGLWLVALAVFGVAHGLRVRRSGKQWLSLSFLCMMGSMYVVLPVGVCAHQVFPLVLRVLLLMGYALSMVYYGSVYKSTYFMIAGCVLAFLSVVGVAFGHGGSMLGGGIAMLLLGVVFAWFTYRLYSRRRSLQIAVMLLQKRREQQRK